ncbi:MAG: YhcH/YjgK/YiaL family protein [Kiritimatiellia bacterium]
MIVDTLPHAERYALGERFATAFAWLRDPAHALLEPGHYVIQAENGVEEIFANVQAYPTRTVENCPLEYHRKYADIQFLFQGNEAIGYRPLTADLAETKPYNADSDIGFVAGTGTPIPFDQPETFFVLFPEDAHAPGQRRTTETVKKVIVKVLL